MTFARLPVSLAAGMILLASGCGVPASEQIPNAGAELESAARARGLIDDPSSIDPVGIYASESDRLCIVPSGDGFRVGAAVDYGEGQGCLARGTARGRGRLEMRLGADCRFSAVLEGARVMFPAVLPSGCDRACRGRASLSTLTAERLSASASEARTAPGPDGAPLCG